MGLKLWGKLIEIARGYARQGTEFMKSEKLDPELSEKLIEIARSHAEERGWTWIGDAMIVNASFKSEAVWSVRSNATWRGINVSVMIRKSDLAIVHSGYAPY